MNTFRKYGEQYGVGYLLMMAKGYQESRPGNQDVRSRSGAIGVMQILGTRRAGPVNRERTREGVGTCRQ